jgi:hypothetical protein
MPGSITLGQGGIVDQFRIAAGGSKLNKVLMLRHMILLRRG